MHAPWYEEACKSNVLTSLRTDHSQQLGKCSKVLKCLTIMACLLLTTCNAVCQCWFHADACAQPDELSKICGVMGSPTADSWPEGLRLAAALGFSFPDAQPQVRL